MTTFLDEFSKDIWEQTYKANTDTTVDDSFMRTSKAIASVEETPMLQEFWAEKFYEMQEGFKCTSGGRILANAGTEWKGTTLLNCFVSPRASENIDSLEGIISDLKNQSLTLKSEGGWGNNFCQSFDQELFVTRNNESLFIRIIDVLEGDFVFCDDGYVHEVDAVMINTKSNMVKLELSNGETIRCTDDHPFLIYNGFNGTKKWVNAGELQNYDHLVCAFTTQDSGLKIIITEKTLYTEETTVVDLQVRDRHNFAVGKDFVIVHNSYIRPRGSFINGIGVETPGAVKYMELFDKSSDIVTAGSGRKSLNKKAKGKIRKGAQLAALDVSHADVIEFITAKQTPGRLTKFNLSVNCTDKFMEKVMLPEGEDDSWDLIFPETTHPQYNKEWDGDIELWQSKGYPIVVHSTVSAKWLWNLIMQSTYNRAEPGILFLDRANKMNPGNYMEKIVSTNPCLIGSTLVATADGREGIPIQELAEQNEMFYVHCASLKSGPMGSFWTNQVKSAIAFKSGTKEVIEILLSDGASFKCTPDHQLALQRGGYIEAKDSTGVHLRSFIVPDIAEQCLSVVSVRNINEVVDVYDLTVEDNHNFYILPESESDEFYQSCVLVHNCGEQMLAPGGVCCLGTINLTQFVDTKTRSFDYKKLKQHIPSMVRFLDNVNEYSDAPLEEYIYSMRNKRRIGLGVMGWGSSLFMLKIRFGSDEANALREELMLFYARSAYEASIDLAIEKGMFSLCDPIKHAEGVFVQSLGLSDEYMTKLRTTGIRNSSLLSMQPNGGSSIVCNIVSGGIEPIFNPQYIRTSIIPSIPDEIKDQTPRYFEGDLHETDLFKWVKEGDDEILRGVHEGVVYKIDRNRGLLKETVCKDYSIRFLENIDEWDPEHESVVTAMNGISVDDHLNDLMGFAKYVDSAISKCMSLEDTMVIIDDKVVYLDELPMSKDDDSFEPFVGNTRSHTNESVPIISTYNNGSQPTLKITFDDKSSIVCTRNHRIYVKSIGWVRADDVKISMIA